jgi:hypothetical protein
VASCGYHFLTGGGSFDGHDVFEPVAKQPAVEAERLQVRASGDGVGATIPPLRKLATAEKL